MFKKILFCTFFILIFLIPSKQDPNAKTWERHNTIVLADSILAAIDRGDSVGIYGCKIVGQLTKEGEWGRPDTIKSYIDVRGSTFFETVFFEYCYFMEEVVFYDDTLHKYAGFSQVSFINSARFTQTTFDTSASFFKSAFYEDAFFDGTTFREEADFSTVMFKKRADFSRYEISRARGYVFKNTAFYGDANFYNSIFDGDANFSFATFDGQIDLRFIRFNKMNIFWKQLKGGLICDPPVCFKLIKQYDEQRQLNGVDGVYLYMKDQERMEKFWLWRYLEYWFIQLTCGYGVKPWRPLITSALVIILFTFIYLILDTQEQEPLNLGLANPGHQTFKWRPSRGFYYSINTFIIGAPLNWTVGNDHSQKWFRIWTTIERTFGWILLVLFVVTLTRKFIR
jgi:hypothetical protein